MILPFALSLHKRHLSMNMSLDQAYFLFTPFFEMGDVSVFYKTTQNNVLLFCPIKDLELTWLQH